MPVPSGVENQADPIRAGEEEVETEKPGNGGEEAVPTRFGRKGEQEGNEEAKEDVESTEGAPENHAWLITVAHGPADEVRVGLVSEHVGHCGDGDGKGRGVSGVLEGVQLEN